MSEQVGDVQAAGAQILAYVERIENVAERIKDEREAQKEIYSELKGVGFSIKAVRQIVKLRAQDRDKRREEAEILELYATAIGMEV